MNLLIAWLSSTIGIWVAAEVLSGFSVRDGVKGAALVAVVLGLLNALLGFLLFTVIGIGTLGLGFLMKPLTEWLVTALLLVLTDKLSDTLAIRSFGMAFAGAVVITLISQLASRILHAVL